MAEETGAPDSAVEHKAKKTPALFWRVFRVVYPLVILVLLYVIWKDVLPAYRFLTKPVSPAQTISPEPASSSSKVTVTPQSLLESSPSALPAIRETVEKVAPKSARAWVGLGLLYESKGMSAEAVEHYRKAVLLDPELPDAQFRLGYAHLAKNELGSAKQSFEAALRAKPDYLPGLYGLGAALQADGRPKAAQAVYEQIISIKPDEYQALNNLGIIFEELGDRAHALGCYEEAAKLKPNDPVVAENARGARELYGSSPAQACVGESAREAAAPSAPKPAPPPAAPRAKLSGPLQRIRLANGHTLTGQTAEETAEGFWFESGDGARVYVLKSELTNVEAYE